MRIIGIDPGKSGAVCIIDTFDHDFVHTESVVNLLICPTIKVGKKMEYDLNTMHALFDGGPTYRKVYIEKAQAMPKQGTVSMFSYGLGYGAWIALCVANGIPYQLIAPQTWKKAMLRDMSKGKGASIVKAKQLCPGINLIPPGGRKDNHNLAEAYLIAKYGLLCEKE